ncbi:MAG: CDP-alcohol phosphatidyltransferase family protein [Chloroflexi bacterium]|nr:MAG: CDP-alcohol phosphatidyltransferase family protein [Chloroflexota bacterium]
MPAAGDATRILIRPSTVGIVGSAVLLAADLTWLALVRPPQLPLLAAWFAALAVVGAFLPGVANQVSLSRAHLAGPALVYSLLPSRLLELAAVVSLAGLSDLVDGAIARRFGSPTRLGGGLDPVVDGVFFGAVAIGLTLGGAYPWWLALVVILRYALPAVVGAGLMLAGRRPQLHHTPLGQVSTTLIGVLLGGLALFRGLGWSTDVLLVVAEVLLPVAALATFVNLFWANRPAILGVPAPRG